MYVNIRYKDTGLVTSFQLEDLLNFRWVQRV